MTQPKVETVRMGGARWYVNPATGEKVPGVTSVLGVKDKPALVGWAVKMTANAAVDKMLQLAAVAEKNAEAGALALSAATSDRRALEDELKRARYRKTGAASERGDDAHAVIEAIARGDLDPAVDLLPPGVDWAVKAVLEFREEFQAEPLMIEETVWSERHDYAGSFDGIWRLHAFGGRNLLVDVKTSNGVYAETAMQLAAYRYADHVITPHGEQKPLPQIDGAAVLWVRPEGWALIPMRGATERAHRAFLALHDVFMWDALEAKKAIADPVNRRPLRKTART